jgi:hypothetical protein
MLDDLDHDGHLRMVCKRGASLAMPFGVDAQASRDVDALVDVSFDEAFDEINIRLSAGWEGCTGRLGDRTEITSTGITPWPPPLPQCSQL